MMSTASEIEKVINDFTSSKTGEGVYLDLSTENVIILRPLSSSGSIPLGSFWIRVLQHPNNYPVHSHPYKTLYRAGKKYELQLKLDGIAFIVHLVSGFLTINGCHIIEWFVANFPDIMTRYSCAKRICSKTIQKYFDEEQAINLQIEREKVSMKYYREWPLEAIERTVSLIDIGKDNVYYEPVDIEGFLTGQDLETHSHVANLLNADDTKLQLDRLKEGAVIQGTVLYRLWRSVLDMWFSDKEAEVYVISSFIDTERLKNVCDLFIKNRLTASIKAMCISFGSLDEGFAHVRRKTISQYSANDQVFIEYKIYSSIIYPLVEFSSSFIAMVKDGKAQVLKSNSSFDKNSLQSLKPTSVTFIETSEINFLKNYMDPIIN